MEEALGYEALFEPEQWAAMFHGAPEPPVLDWGQPKEAGPGTDDRQVVSR